MFSSKDTRGTLGTTHLHRGIFYPQGRSKNFLPSIWSKRRRKTFTGHEHTNHHGGVQSLNTLPFPPPPVILLGEARTSGSCSHTARRSIRLSEVKNERKIPSQPEEDELKKTAIRSYWPQRNTSTNSAQSTEMSSRPGAK